MKKVFGILGLLVFLWVFLAVNTADSWTNLLDSNFLSPNNVENLLRRTAMFGLLGIGVAFVIIHSGIDLSIGSVVCLSAALLAIFLRVDYQPLDSARVIEVNVEEQVIRIAEDSVAIERGSVVRFDGGSSQRNLFTVTAAASNGGVRSLSVDRPLVAGERQNRLNVALPLIAFSLSSSDSAPSITLAGEHSRIQARDRVYAFHPAQGYKDLRIEQALIENGNTRLVLRDELGRDFSTEWYVIPLERKQRMPIAAAVACVLGVGLLLGLCHGLLVTLLKLPPFVVTLCGLLIYRGLARWLVDDQPVGFQTEYDDTLRMVAREKLPIWTHLDAETGEVLNSFGIPIPFLIFIGVAIVAAVFLNKTVWGRYLLALGRNEDAARYSGINTSRIVIVAYMICTALAATSGMLFGLDSNQVSPSSFGNFFELYAIAAAVLGGCSLRGGEGSIFGVIVGTALMQTLYNMIMLLKVSDSFKISDTLEFVIIGVVILAGVIADEVFKKANARRRAAAQAKSIDS